MPRRIEVELTSTRDDGTWTWRAAGARQPKGELDGSLLYGGAKVGDIVRADADFALEGITIVTVLPPKGARSEPERLEIIGPPRRDEPGVTTVLAPKGRGSRRDSGRDHHDGRDSRERRDGRSGPGGRDGRDARGPRSSRPGDVGGPRRDRGAAAPGGRPGTERSSRRPDTGPVGRSDRRPRPARPATDAVPRPKRLKAGRLHRNAVLAALPDTHKPIAEQLIRGGIPAVRQAVDHQNGLLRADNKPTINPDPLMDIAERLMPVVRSAEWRDKAEAALAEADEVDVRDLRSVVVAADAGARDEDTRALAEQLRAALTARVDREHHRWLDEINDNLKQGRLVRALRLSSRPPKAGAPFPTDLAKRLADSTGESLTADITPDRYATVLDALALSPVHLQVQPAFVPDPAAPELIAAVKKAARQLPQIANRFGIGPSAPRGATPRGAAPVPPPPPLPPPPPVATAPTVTPDETAPAPAVDPDVVAERATVTESPTDGVADVADVAEGSPDQL